MEKLKDIDLVIDKDQLTISVLISQHSRPFISYQPDLIVKSYKLPNYLLVSPSKETLWDLLSFDLHIENSPSFPGVSLYSSVERSHKWAPVH